MNVFGLKLFFHTTRVQFATTCKHALIFLFFSFLTPVSAQDSLVESLEAVMVSGTRMMIPFSQESRSITLITADQIQRSPASSLAELLQQEAGVDIRRRGAMEVKRTCIFAEAALIKLYC